MNHKEYFVESETFSINDYNCKCIRITLRPEDRMYLYTAAVHDSMSLFIGVVFGMIDILIDVEYYERFVDYCEDLGILTDAINRPLRYISAK